MKRRDYSSVWFDEAAMVATTAEPPLIVCVCRDLPLLESLLEHLESSLPALGPMETKRVSAESLLSWLEDHSTRASKRVIALVEAASGDDANFKTQWDNWNRQRERLLEAVGKGATRCGVFWLVTSTRMAEVARHAPDLLSVCHVLTVADWPIAVGNDDADLRRAFEQARTLLESRYQLSTDEFTHKLLTRQPLEVSEADRSRWEAVASALREPSES